MALILLTTYGYMANIWVLSANSFVLDQMLSLINACFALINIYLLQCIGYRVNIKARMQTKLEKHSGYKRLNGASDGDK